MTSKDIVSKGKRKAVYWRGSAEIRFDVITLLRQSGYEIYQCRKFEDVVRLCEADSSTLLVVDGSASGGEASQRAVEVNTANQLYETSIMFIAGLAHQRIEICRQHFKNIFPIEVPYKKEDVNKALQRINLVEVAKKEEALPKVLKTGGAQFARAAQTVFFDDNKLLSDLPYGAKVKEMLGEMDSRNRWLGLHARRVALLVSTMSNFLEIEKKRQQNVKAVGMMLNIAAKDSLREFRQINPLLKRSKDDIKHLAKTYREGSKFIKEKINDDLAWRTVRAIADLLDAGATPESKVVVEDAQFVMLADFADRACWNRKDWDPRSARSVMRVLREGFEYVQNKALIEALARSLAQSLLATCREMGVYGDTANPQKVIEAKAKVKEKSFAKTHKETNIWELAPGMILTDPVISSDGTLVACPALRLDEDMLWRLWCVLGLKPMDHTVLVSV